MSWTCAWCQSTEHFGTDCPERPKYGNAFAVLAPDVADNLGAEETGEGKGWHTDHGPSMWHNASLWLPASDWPVLTWSVQGLNVASYDEQKASWTDGIAVEWWMPIPDPPALAARNKCGPAGGATGPRLRRYRLTPREMETDRNAK